MGFACLFCAGLISSLSEAALLGTTGKSNDRAATFRALIVSLGLEHIEGELKETSSMIRHVAMGNDRIGKVQQRML